MTCGPDLAALRIDLSLLVTICRLFSPYVNLFHVASLRVLAVVYLVVMVASVGFRLDT